MSSEVQAPAQAPAPAPLVPAPPRREAIVVKDDSQLSFLLDTGRFEHLQRIARLMALSSVTPKHLLGDSIEQTQANCFRVVNQAMRWGMDPFAVVDETYVVNGRLGYQGKLVAAVINTRTAYRLKPVYSTQTGKAFAAVIIGASGPIEGPDMELLRGAAESDEAFRKALPKLHEKDILAIRISVEQAATTNKMWTSDPEQKLFYSGATKWARRYFPEVLLGVLSEDEVDVDIPPSPPVGRVNLFEERPVENGHKEPAKVEEKKEPAPAAAGRDF